MRRRVPPSFGVVHWFRTTAATRVPVSQTFHKKPSLDTRNDLLHHDLMKKILAFLTILSALSVLTPVYAVEVAPRISDREIIESLAELKTGQQAINKRIDDLQVSTNQRFDTLQWMLGLFITVALFILGAMGRILWVNQARLVQIETSLETQKDELSFLKALIERLLPPKGVL